MTSHRWVRIDTKRGGGNAALASRAREHVRKLAPR
jgi:hypothetical protein